jgi:hypothetical protein
MKVLSRVSIRISSRRGLHLIMVCAYSLSTAIAIASICNTAALAMPKAQSNSLKDGRYVDLVGSEDYFLVVKDGVIIEAQCGPSCDSPVARRDHADKHHILSINPTKSTLLVRVPYGHIYAFCHEELAPSVKRFNTIQCDYNRGWSQ